MFGTISKLSKRIAGFRSQEILLRDLQQQGKINILSINGETNAVPKILFNNAEEIDLFGGNVKISAPKDVADAIMEISHSGLAKNISGVAQDSTNGFAKALKDLYGVGVELVRPSRL